MFCALITLILVHLVCSQCPFSAPRIRVSRQLPEPLNGILRSVLPPRPPENASSMELLLWEAEQHAWRTLSEVVTADGVRNLRGSGFAASEIPYTVSGIIADVDDSNRRGSLRDLVSRYVAERTGDIEELRNINLRDTSLEYICNRVPSCPPSLYRSYNGSCNNLQNPTWGMSLTEYTRLLPHAYEDGLSAPRGSNATRPLPNARRVSFTVHPTTEYLMERINDLWAAFAFFLVQDTCGTATPFSLPLFNLAECCTPEVLRNPELRSVECLPIPVPENDPFYTQYEETCIHFRRHAAGSSADCTLGPRYHTNVKTAYLDGALIYSNEEDANAVLRTFQGGRKISQRLNGLEYPLSDSGPFLPSHLPDGACFADTSNPESICALSGDFINAESAHSSVLHTLYLRQHNDIADRLFELNPHWDDERIHQETRKIVVAQYQIVLYREFIAPFLGPEYVQQYQLALLEEGFLYDYDPTVNGALTDEFCQIGFQIHHSTFPNNFLVRGVDGSLEEISADEFIMSPMNASQLDDYIAGAINKRTPASDYAMSTLLSTRTFARVDSNNGVNEPFGIDTIASAIQRGRDHGIAPYNQYRRYCNLEEANSFDDLENWMPVDAVRRLRSVYQNVNDIDAIAGALSESPSRGSLAGPVVSCILGEQYRRSKISDRFWVENGGMPHSFTPDQLREIRQISLSRLICDYSNDIQEMPLSAFLIPSDANPLVDCEDARHVRRIDLTPWQDTLN